MRGAHWGAHPCPTVGYKPLGQHPGVPRCKVPPALGTSGRVPGFAWNGVGLTFGYHGDRVTLGMMRNMDPTGDNMGDPGGLLCAPLTDTLFLPAAHCLPWEEGFCGPHRRGGPRGYVVAGRGPQLQGDTCQGGLGCLGGRILGSRKLLIWDNIHVLLWLCICPGCGRCRLSPAGSVFLPGPGWQLGGDDSLSKEGARPPPNSACTFPH